MAKKLVYLGYIDGDVTPGWAVCVDGVWQLMPRVYAHLESVTERGGTPKAIKITAEEYKDGCID